MTEKRKNHGLNRRSFLGNMSSGLGGIALAHLGRNGSASAGLEPGVLSVLADAASPVVIPEVKEGSPSTGRRSALASCHAPHRTAPALKLAAGDAAP